MARDDIALAQFLYDYWYPSEQPWVQRLHEAEILRQERFIIRQSYPFYEAAS